MPDDLADLRRLAPLVDADAARAEFDRRRGGSPTLPRWPIAAAAAVMLLVVGAVALVAGGDDDEPLATGAGGTTPLGDGADVPFEVLSVAEAVDPMGTLLAATEEKQFVDLWVRSGAEDPTPDVDFAADVVVSITIPDDACPPELRGFAASDDTLTPRFVETETECEEPLIPKTYVVRLPWVALWSSFTLRLPADDAYGFAEQLLTIHHPSRSPEPSAFEPAGGSEPSCPQIEAFAEVAAHAASAADYQASDSPADLADQSDVVLYGHLTGVTEIDPSGRGASTPLVGYEVEIAALYKTPPGADLVAAPMIAMLYTGTVETIESAADTGVTGIPVVVFAHLSADGRSPLQAGVEGFVTACEDGPLLGFPFQGEWTGIPSLDALNARLEEHANP